MKRDGSVADPRGAPPARPPTDQNFLNFMHFFWENLANFYVGAPSYEESWIRPCGCKLIIEIFVIGERKEYEVVNYKQYLFLVIPRLIPF